MGEDQKPLEGQSLEDLEQQVKGDGSPQVFDIENEEERMVHSDKTVDARIVVGNITFERMLFGAGVGLLVVLFSLSFTFFSTLGIGDDNQADVLTINNPEELYEKLLEDENYLFAYTIGNEVKSYDTLKSTFEDGATGINLISADKDLSGEYNITANNQQVVDGKGQVVMRIEDPDLRVNRVIDVPDHESFIFDVEPASQKAREKFGFRVGAYEYDLKEEQAYTLVSDALPGEDIPGNDGHYVYILSISPKGRYFAYTNNKKLFLYDRLSGVSVEMAELNSFNEKPATGWKVRPTTTEVQGFQQTFTR